MNDIDWNTPIDNIPEQIKKMGRIDWNNPDDRERAISAKWAECADRIEQLEAENSHFKTRCEYLQSECEKLVVMAKELRKANHTLRGLVDVVLDADEFNGHDVSKADRELRIPKAWITEARKAVGDD